MNLMSPISKLAVFIFGNIITNRMKVYSKKFNKLDDSSELLDTLDSVSISTNGNIRPSLSKLTNHVSALSSSDIDIIVSITHTLLMLCVTYYLIIRNDELIPSFKSNKDIRR